MYPSGAENTKIIHISPLPSEGNGLVEDQPDKKMNDVKNFNNRFNMTKEKTTYFKNKNHEEKNLKPYP